MRPTDRRRLVILAEGEFGPHSGKTAYGVIRYGRDDVVAVIDSTKAGQSVDAYLPGHDIPIVASLDEALACPTPPDALLIGIAPTGGRLPDTWRTDHPRRDRRRASTSCPACTRSSATTRSSRPPRPRAGPRSSTTDDRPTGWRPPSGAATARASG